MELVTKTRTEHLTEQDKKENSRRGSVRNPLESFLGIAEQEDKAQGATNGVSMAMNVNHQIRNQQVSLYSLDTTNKPDVHKNG